MAKAMWWTCDLSWTSAPEPHTTPTPLSTSLPHFPPGTEWAGRIKGDGYQAQDNLSKRSRSSGRQIRKQKVSSPGHEWTASLTLGGQIRPSGEQFPWIPMDNSAIWRTVLLDSPANRFTSRRTAPLTFSADITAFQENS